MDKILYRYLLRRLFLFPVTFSRNKNYEHYNAEEGKEALKNGAKEIAIVDNKAKPTGEMVSLEFAAWRSCSFAISALTQMEDSKKNWKLASPSDGYKY